MHLIAADEIELIDGGSAKGATVVLSAALIGAAAGSVVPGVGTLAGAVAGAISAGGHALVIWNVVN